MLYSDTFLSDAEYLKKYIKIELLNVIHVLFMLTLNVHYADAVKQRENGQPNHAQKINGRYVRM